MQNVDRLLLRPSEAAEVLGVGRSKLYALLASGELPSVRLGHSVRVPVAELQHWIEEQVGKEVAPKPERAEDVGRAFG